MMTQTPNDFEEALAYLRGQAAHLNPPLKYGANWHNDCQALAHVEYGVMEGGNPSAYAQWLATPAEHKHRGGDPDDAPLGALLCSKGSSPFGHIWTGGRPLGSGAPGGWGPDMNPGTFGGIAKFERSAPMDVWGHTYLGWISEINGFALDLTKARQPAKPIENKRYKRLARSINLLEGAIDVAKKDHDKRDIEALRKQLASMKVLYKKIKHS